MKETQNPKQIKNPKSLILFWDLEHLPACR
jgi:hypothetical protein